MITRERGRGFKVFISFLLLGIFIELFVIIGVLTGDVSRTGNVAVVEILGVIEDPIPAIRQIKRYEKQESVKAIVLRVDSPGGIVGASQEIHDQVAKTKKKKKIVASFGNVAASGGYYVAASADKIVADPGTITGSLGVIAEHFVIGDVLKRFNIRWEVIKSGDIKDMGSPLRSLSDKERGVLQAMTDDVHMQFIEAVSAGRGMSIEDVTAVADGRVVSGRQAVKIGLVDKLGGLETAITLAAKLAGIQEDVQPIYPEREKFSWLRSLAEGKFNSQSDFKLQYRMTP